MQIKNTLRGLIISFVAGFTALCCLNGQAGISGCVVDEETREPLAFVNIVYNQKGTGTTTSLDGYFSIVVEPEFLRLSYVGYEPVTFFPGDIAPDDPVILSMKRKPYVIEEVIVYPGINPAHRIIENAFMNRRLNNPEMLPSFSYTLYNKLYFTLLPDTIISAPDLPGSPDISIRLAFTGRDGDKDEEREARDVATSEKADSSELRRREFLDKQHLFLMESVSKREYIHPGRNLEQVIASRVSGFQDPSFTLLATQIQSFSFYNDFISILDRRYLNPISRGSRSRYSFILEDSLFTEQNDTLFIISFRPYPNRNFDGLQGVVYINSNRYAVQNVIAEPFDPGSLFTVRIQQNYVFVDNMQWFPSELNTDIIFGRENVLAGPDNRYRLVGIGKSYLSGIKIDPLLDRRKFGHIELVIQPDAHRKPDDFWDRYRVEPLSGKDRETYHYIDSIGREANFDRTLRVFETLASGYIPWRFINIDYRSLLDYNYFEGLRPGMRLVTNERLSDRFSLGGHIAWGVGDGKLKFGCEASVRLYRPGEVNLGVSFSRDVEEAGSYSFIDGHSVFSTESYRRFMIGRMDHVDRYGLFMDFRMMRHFSSRLYLNSSGVAAGDEYLFFANGDDRDRFHFTETGIMLRFAYRERFMQTPKGTLISLGTDFPVIWINYGHGSDLFGGEYEYSRIQARLQQTFVSRRFGVTTFVIEGGYVDRDVPFQKLYSGRGSYRNFSLDAANSFAAMRMGEFASSEFISFFFRHNFKSLLYRSGNFRPELMFVTNIGFGRTQHSENHLNITLKSPEKGYYESGILINNLYRKLFMGYGLGVFYRYGTYSFSKKAGNLAFKLSFTMNLG